MPIYMDRHDVSESVTAEHVAQLHKEDLKIQDAFGCRGLTYWFDDKRKTAFCLVEAPNEQAIRDMHDTAHGQIPHSIIEVDAGIVESFLGRIEDPKKNQDGTSDSIDDPAFRTIMVIAKASSFSGQSTFSKSKDSLTAYFEAIHNVINANEGRVVRETPDLFIVSFESVSKAVATSLEIKSIFKGLGFDSFVSKIGLSAGVPVTEKKSIFEDTINLADRICAMIPGDIIVSAEVAELALSENINTFSNAQNFVILKFQEEKLITQLMDFIDLSCSDSNLKVDDFSKPAGLSKSQLYRKLKTLTGKSPNTFLKDYRLKKALALLNKNSGNVSEIAFETGFSSPSYFSKCFHKKYGHSPSEYLPVNA
ncbi:nickel-binding protein [Algoriphagus yeomjeoni]|uniref:nickel-binding protein n=1 Tax=Algoriphagus yeomjeoni TaxID=291403 RepID=UPI003CE48484